MTYPLSRTRHGTLPEVAERAEFVIKKRFSSVWDAIEDTPAEAENMKLRSALMMALKEHIARTGMSQSHGDTGSEPFYW